MKNLLQTKKKHLLFTCSLPSAFCFLLSAFCFLPSLLMAQTKADTLYVSHYDIHLEIKNMAQEHIKGFADIHLSAKIAPLTNINLDFFALTVDSVVNGGQQLPFEHEGHNLNIVIPFTHIGEDKIVRVYYGGKPAKESWGGFYMSADFAYNIGVGMSSNPNSIGRFWFPCIDDFNSKSTYTFNITTDSDKKAVCGGMLTNSTDLGDAMLWKWELTDKIPTYLASVAVGDFQLYSDTVHSVSGAILPIEIYADPVTLPKVEGSFANLKKFIHIFEKRWGPCFWQRVGYVILPFNKGAMEHATNIAFPRNAVSGNTNNAGNQSLIAHELAHSWLGNLVTCSTSQNMWINEGFSRYGELLCDEILDPSLVKYKAGVRDLHSKALKNGEKYALNNVPIHDTYHTGTVYDKGGLVAYTLRYYMGDDLYFSSIKQLLANNRYGNMDSEELFEQLGQFSGLDLTDFYLGWVDQPGFLNFNIDYITHKGSNNYEIAFKQKLYHAHRFANNNLIDVEFVSASGERVVKEKLQFSGESAFVDVVLPFEPVFWAIDPHHKKGDACFKYTQHFTKTGSTNLADANLRVQVDEIEGEAILRVEHNVVTPSQQDKNEHLNIIKISETHFWRIGFLKHTQMQATYFFTIHPRTYEKELLQGYTHEDLVLLYRKDASHDWDVFPTTLAWNSQQNTGTLSTHHILPGEYVFAIVNEISIKEWQNDWVVYPNPTTGVIYISSGRVDEWTSGQVDEIGVYDIFGRKQKAEGRKQKAEGRKEKFPSNELEGWNLKADGVAIDISHLPAGIYFLKISTQQGDCIKKVIKQ